MQPRLGNYGTLLLRILLLFLADNFMFPRLCKGSMKDSILWLYTVTKRWQDGLVGKGACCQD